MALYKPWRLHLRRSAKSSRGFPAQSLCGRWARLRHLIGTTAKRLGLPSRAARRPQCGHSKQVDWCCSKFTCMTVKNLARISGLFWRSGLNANDGVVYLARQVRTCLHGFRPQTHYPVQPWRHGGLGRGVSAWCISWAQRGAQLLCSPLHAVLCCWMPL